MSKVQRKEYQETKITRTLSPGRAGTRGSSQNLAEFDNNLDHLLEDLQSSVTGPTSNTLGSTKSSTYKEHRVIKNGDAGRTNSLNRVTHLKASNPITEYSTDDSYNYTSPDGTKSVKSFKKETYYSSSGGDNVAPEKIRMQNNINQLDSLLDDLKQVKHGSSINNTGVDPGLVETSKSRVMMGKKVVERDIQYVDTPPRARTLDRLDREGSVNREIQYIDEGTYGETRPIHHRTPSPSHSQMSTLTRQKKVTNVHAYPMEVIETTTPDINPEILANLDHNLLPSGNTKVTTTIKTYTYEIPGSGYKTTGLSPDSERYVYSPNQSQTTPSKSFEYRKIENSDVTNTVVYPPPSEQSWKTTDVYKENITSTQSAPPYQRPAPPTGADTTIIKETTTTRNYQPGYHPYPEPPPPTKQTYVYNETTTTKNINEGYPDDHIRPVRRSPIQREPPVNETYIYKETHNTTTNKTSGPYPNGYPPSKTVIINKTETNTTDNYDSNRYPYSGRPTDSPHSRRPNEPYDPNNVNITYKYTSHSSSTNNYKGYPPGDESQPLLRPQPFPSDGEVDGPPKRVDELMAKIGNEPPDSPLNSGFVAHEAELIHQKKVDTLKHQQEANDLQKKERNLPPTKNITGPPVYYPPGHEMFAKKEESGAWRAEGAMAKESGKYKYEAESSSKSKSRSGAAIVPVCLPLCCGIPCTLL